MEAALDWSPVAPLVVEAIVPEGVLVDVVAPAPNAGAGFIPQLLLAELPVFDVPTVAVMEDPASDSRLAAAPGIRALSRRLARAAVGAVGWAMAAGYRLVIGAGPSAVWALLVETTWTRGAAGGSFGLGVTACTL